MSVGGGTRRVDDVSWHLSGHDGVERGGGEEVVGGLVVVVVSAGIADGVAGISVSCRWRMIPRDSSLDDEEDDAVWKCFLFSFSR